MFLWDGVPLLVNVHQSDNVAPLITEARLLPVHSQTNVNFNYSCTSLSG